MEGKEKGAAKGGRVPRLKIHQRRMEESGDSLFSKSTDANIIDF